MFGFELHMLFKVWDVYRVVLAIAAKRLIQRHAPNSSLVGVERPESN